MEVIYMRIATILMLLLLPLVLFAGTNLLPAGGVNNPYLNNTDLRAYRMTSFTWGNWATSDFNMANRTTFGFWQDNPMAVRTAAGEYLVANQWWGNKLIDYVPDANFQYIMQANHDNVTGMVTSHNFRYTYTYDDQHRLTEILKEQFQTTTTSWMAYERLHIIYENGDLIKTIGWTYNWGSPDYERYDYEYANDKVSSQIRYSSADSTTWNATTKNEYTYHSSDTSSSAGFISFISHYLPLLMPLDRDITYGAYAQVAQSMYFGGSWLPMGLNTYTYNGNNQLTECLVQTTYPSVMNSQRISYSYDSNGNMETMIKCNWNGDWENQLKETYTWESVVGNDDATAAPVNALTLQVYPSPFTTKINVNIPSKERREIQFGIYNIKGQCVLSDKISPNELSNIDTAHLANGIYFVRASQGSHATVKKVIKIQ
jgi:YD repeat-containing protein